jgi:hypothetical protein
LFSNSLLYICSSSGWNIGKERQVGGRSNGLCLQYEVQHSPRFLPFGRMMNSDKRRIMLVDDEYDVVYSLKTVLEETKLFQVDGHTDPILALSIYLQT